MGRSGMQPKPIATMSDSKQDLPALSDESHDHSPGGLPYENSSAYAFI